MTLTGQSGSEIKKKGAHKPQKPPPAQTENETATTNRPQQFGWRLFLNCLN